VATKSNTEHPFVEFFAHKTAGYDTGRIGKLPTFPLFCYFILLLCSPSKVEFSYKERKNKNKQLESINSKIIYSPLKLPMHQSYGIGLLLVIELGLFPV
jgi:hypothetical protein